ncbi:two-component system sensor histidine kinase NtrB [Kordiimonas pumila]|uniref:histidine kinase n=1 Tax=Kordiimonas pumila TaxID=2161677 RepID=A0ABV7D1M9_9PROT|nr:ATP-binding protein [Kordiimonas pumila]
MAIFPKKSTIKKADTPELAIEVLHSLYQAIVLIGPDDKVINVFAHSEAVFEQSRESMIGLDIDNLRGIGYAVKDLVQRSRRDFSPLNSYDVSCLPPIGDIELVDLHAHPFGEGEDILLTVQPRRISAFLEKRNEMEAAARSVSGLASMLAHEIKNPLSGIRGAAQLMGRAIDDKHARLTELICKEVDRIKALVDELETFTNPTEKLHESVNIHEVLDHVLNVAVAGFGAQASFMPRFDPSLPGVYGHYDRLIQVFLNLIKNAIEASGPGAQITVTTAYRHGIWLRGAQGRKRRLPIEVTVRDNGPGIPEHLKGHLFDPFVSGKDGGTGLGLALVARFVSEMGGTVVCDNHPQGGAVFKVQLALYEDFKHEQ